MTARLTSTFRDRVESLELSEAAVAKMLGLSRQYYNRVWRGVEPPSTRFMVSAITAGLAENFADVAEPALREERS